MSPQLSFLVKIPVSSLLVDLVVNNYGTAQDFQLSFLGPWLTAGTQHQCAFVYAGAVFVFVQWLLFPTGLGSLMMSLGNERPALLCDWVLVWR